MKTILCYGDSNTWGFEPGTGARYGRDVRWTGVLAAALGPDYAVIEEGLNGRTTVHDDPYAPHRDGLAYLPACLDSHAPLDLVVIMLGTNDLKPRFGAGPDEIAEGAALLGGIAKRSGAGPGGTAPRVLLVCPPPILEVPPLAGMFAGGVEKSRRLAAAFGFWVDLWGFAFLDVGAVIASSPVDGIHFDPPEHRKLGEAIAAEVRAALA